MSIRRSLFGIQILEQESYQYVIAVSFKILVGCK